MSVNKVILVGNLGRDPESRRTSSQMAVVTFSVATNERRKEASGNWVDHTEWHRVTAFGKTAEFCENYLKKGSQIYVEGKLRTNKWQDKDGNDRYTTEILASEVRFVGNRRDNAANDDSPVNFGGGAAVANLKNAEQLDPGPVDSAPFDDDDIPF